MHNALGRGVEFRLHDGPVLWAMAWDGGTVALGLQVGLRPVSELRFMKIINDCIISGHPSLEGPQVRATC